MKTPAMKELTIIEVFDILGNVVLKLEYAGEREIDLSDQPSGIYRVKVQTASGVLSRKLLKQ